MALQETPARARVGTWPSPSALDLRLGGGGRLFAGAAILGTRTLLAAPPDVNSSPVRAAGVVFPVFSIIF